jgi:hypothetical protein
LAELALIAGILCRRSGIIADAPSLTGHLGATIRSAEPLTGRGVAGAGGRLALASDREASLATRAVAVGGAGRGAGVIARASVGVVVISERAAEERAEREGGHQPAERLTGHSIKLSAIRGWYDAQTRKDRSQLNP